MDQLPKELRGALYLSYADLPSYLKQCFLYCSLFREDSIIYREHLIHYWVAEGFVQEEEDSAVMEDIAEDYYNQLIRRNLLQHSNMKGCRMHDLLRSLAQFLIGKENLCIDSDAAQSRQLNANNLRNVRRLSFVSTSEMTTSISNGIWENTRGLRSLLWHGEDGQHVTLPSDVQTMLEGDDLVKVLRHLRVFNLSRSGIKKLPESVGKLVHLRYLNLECTNIDMLPESMGNLVNLQALCLLGCQNLRYLPNGITQLSNLRRLDVRATSLVCLPTGFEQLKQLNRLEGFFVGDADSLSKACKIEELQPLAKLRKLSIFKLERVTTATSILTNKQFLRELGLFFSEPGEDGFEYGETEINAMEELCPSSNLEKLVIVRYPGCRFPRWIPLYNGFSRLESVELYHCKSCTQLPPLGQLGQLKRLTILCADSIVTVGPELFFGGTTGTGVGAFSKLEYLEFWNMPEWEEWELSYDECVHKGKLLPCLKELSVSECPKLRSLPSGLQQAASLKSLSIDNADCIQEVKNLPFLTEKLKVWECPCLREVQHLPLLQDLMILDCPQLTRLSDLNSLQKLNISNCQQLARVSDLDSLRQLHLSLGNEAERLPDWLLDLALERQKRNAKPDLEFQLRCSSIQFERYRKGGEDWPITKLFPGVCIVI